MRRLISLTLLLSGCHLALPLGTPQKRDAAPPDAATLDLARDLLRTDLTADSVTDLPACPVCPFGCDATGKCKRLVPANVGATPLPKVCTGVIAAAGQNIDTSTCTLGSLCNGAIVTVASRSYCVFHIDALTLPDTARVTGEHPLVIVAQKSVTISGTLDLAAEWATPGPGGAPGGKIPGTVGGADGQGPGGGKHCTCGDISLAGMNDDCGGGGAGHIGQGGEGGQEAGGCGELTGGNAYGGDALEPLIGGSGGASGHNAVTMPNVTQLGDGGAGGGALQISAQGTIRVDGAITVGGGGGGQGVGMDSASGGGSGSGGAILLEATRVLGAGWLAANGGGGGGGAESADGTTADPGKNGRADGDPAPGGKGGGTGSAGGQGGTGTQSPQPGVNIATSGLGGCGGGGGAAGRIRVNVPAGATVEPQHSGSYSVGTPKTQ